MYSHIRIFTLSLSLGLVLAGLPFFAGAEQPTEPAVAQTEAALLSTAPSLEGTVPQTESPKAAPKAPGTAEITQGNLIFGQGAPAPSVFSETNDSQPIVEYKPQGTDDSLYSQKAPTAVGVYTARVTYPETGDFLQAQSSVDFTIRAYVTGMELTGPDFVPSRTYNGLTRLTTVPSLSFSFTVEGSSHSPRPGQDYEIVSATLTEPWVNQDKTSQNLLITVRFLEGMFAPAPDLPTTFSLHANVSPAPLTVTALEQAAPEGFRTGLDQVTVTGLAQGDILEDIALSENASGTHLVPDGARVTRDGQDVTNQYVISYQKAPLIRSARITADPVPQKILTYNGLRQPLLKEPGTAEYGKMVYSLSFQSSQSGALQQQSDWSPEPPRASAPGIYTVRYKAQGETLQNSPERSVTSIVAPKVLSVTAEAQKEYDGTPYISPEQIQVTLDESQILPGEQVSVRAIEGSAFQQSRPGTDLKVIPGNVILEGTHAENYTVKITSFLGAILQGQVHILPDNAEKFYGQQDPVLSFRTEGLSEEEALQGSLARQPGEAAGTYPILPGTLTEDNNPGYTLSQAPAAFTLKPAPVDLKLTVSGRKAKPGKNLTVTVTARNQAENLMDTGWAQPASLELNLGDTPLQLVSTGSGTWTASYPVPKDASGTLHLTATVTDPNYQSTAEELSLKVSGGILSLPRRLLQLIGLSK